MRVLVFDTKLPTLTFHPRKSTGMEIQNSNPVF